MTIPVADVNEMQFSSGATSPARARNFVQDFLQARELHYIVDDVRLVVSELVTNAVIHARTPVRVRIEEMPFCVKLTVYDEAVDIPVPSFVNRVSTDDDGGRGLWIVDAFTDHWGNDLVGRQGKCTWALFAVRPRASWVVDT